MLHQEEKNDLILIFGVIFGIVIILYGFIPLMRYTHQNQIKRDNLKVKAFNENKLYCGDKRERLDNSKWKYFKDLKEFHSCEYGLVYPIWKCNKL